MNPYRQAYLHIKKFSRDFWVLIAAAFLNQIGNMVIVFVVVYLHTARGFSLVEASTAFLIVSSSMLAVGLLGGTLIDKVGAPRMMWITIICNGLVLAVFPFLKSYIAILGNCVLWGIFYGIFRPASQASVSHLSPPGFHKVSFSVYRLAINLGMSIGPALGGYLAAHSFDGIFYGNALMNILSGLLLFFALPNNSYQGNTEPAEKKNGLTFVWLKRDRALRFFIIALVPASMVFFQHEATLPVFLNGELGHSFSFYGFLFTINTLMIVFLELALNIATIQWSYRAHFTIGAALTGAGFFGLAFFHSTAAIIWLTVIWTFGEMILYPAASSYVAELAPVSHRGSYMSLLSSSSNMGMLLGPWLGGFVMQYYGSTALWLACGGLTLISVLMFVRTKPLPKAIPS